MSASAHCVTEWLCTVWYANAYLSESEQGHLHTRIGTFRLAGRVVP